MEKFQPSISSLFNEVKFRNSTLHAAVVLHPKWALPVYTIKIKEGTVDLVAQRTPINTDTGTKRTNIIFFLSHMHSRVSH